MSKQQKKYTEASTRDKDNRIADLALNESIPAASVLFANEAMLKKIFLGSILIMLLVTWFAGFNVGFHSDDIELNNYGKANLAFYTSGGNDTSVMGKYFYMLRYYGNAYELIATTINKVTGLGDGIQEFNVRHIVCEFFGVLSVLFTGLVTRKLSKSWLAAIFASWLIFLTPSYMGHFFINTRDIPFSTGYIASIYFILNFLDELPAPTWKTTMAILLSFAFTINIRAGGLMLLFYLVVFMAYFLFTNGQLLAQCIQNAKDIGIKVTTAISGAIILAIVTWPFVLMDPKQLIEALGVVKKFPLKVRVNFEGESIDSFSVPPYYIPKYMLITIPIVVILCLIAGLVIYFMQRKKYNVKYGIIAVFAVVFPVAYAVGSNSALYTSWRHFLFIFPLMAAFGGIFLYDMQSRLQKPVYRMAFWLVFGALLVTPVLFCIKNNPYEYCYFNELAGGFKGGFYNYDTDYWEISVKNGLDWLMENEHLAQSKDTITVATNAFDFATYYIGRHYPSAKVKVIYAGIYSRNQQYWNYAVYNSLFIKSYYLENFFPPAQTIHSEKIDDLPVTAVIKDLARLDYKAIEAVQASNYKLADSLFTAHIATTKDHNPAIDPFIAVAKALINQNDEAISAANRALEYHFSNELDYSAQCALGDAYANKRQYSLSVKAFGEAASLMPGDGYSRQRVLEISRLMQGK